MRSIFIFFLFVAFTPFASAQTTPQVTGPPTWLLEDSEAFFMQPKWSPDGSRLVVTGPKYQGLWIIDRESGDLRLVSEAPSAGYGAEWSPGGTALLTRVAKYENRRRYNAVMVYDLKAEESFQLTDYRTSMPALPHWTPEGKVYLYRSDQEEVEMFAPELSASEAEQAETAKPLYFRRGGRIAKLSLNTPERALLDDALQMNGAERVTVSASDVETLDPFEDRRLLNVTPSPDGSMVAFEVMGGNLYVMQSDGTGLTDLGRGYRPSWGPSGEWVVFQRTEDDGHRITSADLYAAHVSGNQTVRLTATPNRLEMNPAWSPDGRFIAFDADGRVGILPLSFE